MNKTYIGRIIAAFAATLLSLSCISCNVADENKVVIIPSVTSTPYTFADEVILNLSSANLKIGGFFNLTASYTGSDKNGTFIFESSDSTVASVSSGGRVTANGNGMAIITVKYNDVRGYCSVLVGDIPETADPTGTQVPPVTSAPTETAIKTSVVAPTEIKITNVSSVDRLILDVGKTYQLKAEVYPEGASQEVYWLVGNTRVATIDSKTGLLSAVAAESSWGDGYSTVTAVSVANGGVYTTFNLGVVQRETGVSINAPDKTELEIGDTLKLTTTVEPLRVYKESLAFNWSVSDESIISVDKNGNVKALKEGKATVTVTTVYSKVTDSIEFTVSTPPVTSEPTVTPSPTATPTAPVTATPTAPVTATPTAPVTATPTAQITPTATNITAVTPIISVPTVTVKPTATPDITDIPTTNEATPTGE